MRNGNRYDDSNSKRGKKRPTRSEMLGFGRVSKEDVTGNVEYPQSQVPPRTKLPGRGDPSESLDRFSPHKAAFVGGDDSDFPWELDDDSDLATPEEITDPVQEMNSQRNLTEDCPSTLDPLRFVNQNRAGKRS